MNQRTEEDKARELYGKARDQMRNLDMPPWHELTGDARALCTRLVRITVVEAIQGNNAIRRDVLEYWAAAAKRVTSDKTGIAVAIDLLPDGLQVTAFAPSDAQASILVPWADIMTAITPKGAIDEIIAHLLGQVRSQTEGLTFKGGH